jgi:hypothetical protein
MRSMRQDMDVLRGQLRSGSIQAAYRGLLTYMAGLRAHFAKTHPDYTVSGLYQGYMDMTYFAVVPPSLKQRGLKIAIVFNYEAFRFEAWLAGSNRKVQQAYWGLARGSRWDGCRVVAPAKGVDAIVECDLAEDFDFDDSDTLTARIEERAAEFVGQVERFLSENGEADRG